MRALALLVAAIAATAVAASFAAEPAIAAGGTSYRWIGNSQNSGGDNHSWTDQRNWSPAGVPSDGDSVSIDAPDALHCTVNVDNVPTVALSDFTLSATGCGTSVNGGRLTVTGAFAWDGGTLNTPTVLTGTGTLSGAHSHLNVLSADLEVAGTLTLSGLADSGASNRGGFRIVNPYVLHVRPGGTLNANGANSVQYLSCCNAPARIVNDGTLHVSGGDLTVRAVEVDQNATLSTSAGGRLVSVGAPLTAGPGATYTGAGAWKIENGAKAKFTGTQTLGAGFHLELGGLDVDAPAELGGTATLTGPGEFDWTGGTIEANLTIAHGTSMRVSGTHTGNGKRFLSGQDALSARAAAILTNHGAITVDQGAGVLTGWQATLQNAADGTLTLAPGTRFDTISCCVNPSRLLDNGKLVVPVGASSAAVQLSGVAYRATGGSTSIAAGRTLRVGLAPSALSATAVTGGGTLAVAAPTAVSGTINVGSATTLALLPGGSLDGTATVGGAGALNWTGGSVSGTLTVGPTGGLTISGPDLKTIAEVNGGGTPSKLTVRTRTRISAGTATKHDRIDLGRSTLTLTSATSVGNSVEISNGTLVNTGSLTVDPGRSGRAERGGATSFVNRGTLSVRSGTFQVDGIYTQTAGVTDVAAGSRLNLLYVSRSIALAGGTLRGSGTIGAGITNTAGVVQPGGAATGTLHVAGNYSQGRNGVLAIDLAARSRDRLAVSGQASIGGRLTARNLNYRPGRTARFQVVSAAHLTSSLRCTTTSGTAASKGHWAASHTATALYLAWRAGARTHC
jgi:hypothetical protein